MVVKLGGEVKKEVIDHTKNVFDKFLHESYIGKFLIFMNFTYLITYLFCTWINQLL